MCPIFTVLICRGPPDGLRLIILNLLWKDGLLEGDIQSSPITLICKRMTNGYSEISIFSVLG